MGKARLSRAPNQRTVEQSQVSKFCIDLEGMMLPDAIAAVVEAWYDAQNAESAADWVEDLRLQIKREFGRGWSVRGVGATKLNPEGRCQLTRIAPDRSRSSVIIPVEWRALNAQLIYDWVKDICTFADPRYECSSLQDAFVMADCYQTKLQNVKSKKMQCNSAF